MKTKIKNLFYLIFCLFITNTYFSEAHDSFNGGCKKHCEGSVKVNTMENFLENVNDKNPIQDNYSCLSKSLCRG